MPAKQFQALTPAHRLFGHDVPLPGARTLRVGILFHHDEAQDLILCLGHGDGPGWREDPAEGIILPACALPGLRAALATLEAKYGAGL
jgi:hypothetical protein